MDTTSLRSNKNIDAVLNYYNAMLEKNFDKMAGFLHDDVEFVGPLSQMQGKASVVLAAQNLSKILDDIQVRVCWSQKNQVMIVYDFIFSKLELNLRASGLIDVVERKIIKIELFYDGRPFENNSNQIFS